MFRHRIEEAVGHDEFALERSELPPRRRRLHRHEAHHGLVVARDEDLVAAQNRLAVLLGRAPGSLQDQLAAVKPLPALPTQLATGIPADVLRQRPDIVAAEREGGPTVEPAGYSAAPNPFAAPYSAGSPPPAPYPANPYPAGPTPVRSWGPVEIIAVVGLTVGTFVLPVVGPIIGLVCAWVSSQWTRREKIVATLWAAVAPLIMVLAAAAVFTARVETSSSQVDNAPVVVEEPAQPMPSGEVTP